ncbi:MAG TPA: hypothetical protein VMB50_11525 [Myxococcales bacterium]|nr:hypothetical protein [Myxococcales bacterium]
MLSNLDSPWLKRRLLARVTRATGLELDYDRLELHPLSGLRLDGLVLRTPGRLRAVAPDLARIDSLRVSWSLRHPANAPWIDRVTVHGLSLAWVQDADGESSLSALVPASTTASTPSPTPLSRLPSRLFAGRPPVGRVDVDGVSLILDRVSGPAVDQLSVAGLALAASTAAAPGGFALRLEAGGEGQPLTVAVRRERQGEAPQHADAAIQLSVQASSAGATLAADVRVADQSFVQLPATGELLRLAASAHFDPGEGRTQVELGRATIAGGALDASANAELSDGPTPTLRLAELHCAVDLARLRPWLAAAGVPATVSTGRLQVAGHDLQVASDAFNGSLDMEGKVGALSAKLSPGQAGLAGASLSLHAKPVWRGARLTLALQGQLSLRGLALESAGRQLDIDQLDGDVQLAELTFHPSNPLDAAAAGTLTLRTRSLDVIARRPLVEARGLALTLGVHRSSGAPWNADVQLPIERLRLFGRDGRLLYSDALRLEGHVADVAVDPLHPLEARATAKVALSAGGARLAAGVRADGGNADFELSVDAPTLALAEALAPKTPALPWRSMSLALTSRGRVEGLATKAPRLKQRTEIELDNPALPGARDSAAALKLSLSSSGDARRETLDAHLGASDVTLAGRRLGDGQLAVSAEGDRPARSLRLELSAEGGALPKGTIGGNLSFDRRGKTITYDLSGHLARLDDLRPFLPPGPLLASQTNLRPLQIDLTSQGSLTGLATLRDGLPRPTGLPLASIQAQGTADLRLSQVELGEPRWSVEAPAVELQLGAQASGTSTRVHGELTLGTLDVRSGERAAGVRGLRDRFDAELEGRPGDGVGQLSNELSAQEIRQDFVQELLPEDLAVNAALARTGNGVAQLSRLEIESRAGGTKGSFAGGLVLGDQRHKLSLRGELTQDLARVSGDPGVFSGKGQVTVSLRVASPDMKLFRTEGTVRIQGADVALPRDRFTARSIDGEIPAAVDLSFAGGTLRFLHDAQANPYSLLRFADQHPLLSNSGFLSIASLSTPQIAIAPLFGNLAIQRNELSLSQLDLGVRGGHVSGQCLLDWRGEDSILQARVRASGVLSSHGEPFDGSAALVASLRDRSIDGHAEIVRIGRRHLLDLLDLQDPQRVDPAINRIRRALALGYPDRVRLLFDHGFASVLVTLGGLGRLVRIDELRGIPVEPIVDQVIASLNPSPEEP